MVTQGSMLQVGDGRKHMVTIEHTKAATVGGNNSSQNTTLDCQPIEDGAHWNIEDECQHNEIPTLGVEYKALLTRVQYPWSKMSAVVPQVDGEMRHNSYSYECA